MFPHPTVVNPNTSRLTMNIVKFFEFDQVQIRTVTIGFDLWFVAQDICRILTIVNIGQALSRLDDDEKSYLEGDTLICLTDDPDVTRLSAVNESGLYSLILSSRKKVAKPFKRWVTHDVLPSIRKTGSYLPESLLRDRGAVSR
jgi:anti-repressor protein